MATYLGKGTLATLSIFMNAVGLDKQISFSLQYDRHRFEVNADSGEKRYVCFPSMCHDLETAVEAVKAETTINIIMENKAEDTVKVGCTTTYFLTDEERLMAYFKRLSANLKEPVEVLLTRDNQTACLQ